ncbi:MAG: cation-translocating P-type ATPase [Promethearchaeota archaeon]
MMSTLYYNKEMKEIEEEFETSIDSGLTSAEVKTRLEKFGPNQLEEGKKISPFQRFLLQFKDFLVILLIVAAVVSFIFNDYVEGMVILVIIFINGILGFIQEHRAEQSLEKLKELTGDDTLVIRDGEETRVDVQDLVPGDILLLYEGETIGADARIVEASRLKIEEGILTGESVPVNKKKDVINDEHVALADQKNMAFMGTITVKGRGKAIITGTGMNTEIGKIAKSTIESGERETPLQMQLNKLGKILGIVVIAVVVGVLLAEIIAHAGSAITYEEIVDMMETAIALAVSAVPEGMAAAITLTLAIGVQRMAKRRAIIRQLPAVEALGSVEVICTDKTGTLTQNKMTVQRIWSEDLGLVEVTGSGYLPKGKFINIKEQRELTNEEFAQLEEIVMTGFLASTAKIQYSSEKNQWICEGDPTEGALVVVAMKTPNKLDWEEAHELKPNGEIFFDSDRKLMTMVYETAADGAKKTIAYMKGSPQSVINACNRAVVGGQIIPITDEVKEHIIVANKKLADKAFRVLGVARRNLPNDQVEFKIENTEKDMIFLGLEAMIDPARDEVKTAVEKCKLAGIRIIMITGDQKDTAMAIARALDLKPFEDEVYTSYTAAELEQMTEEEFKEVVKDLDVCARASPTIKKRIVKTLQDDFNHVVAMTGDGVNDAPALKSADIGVAMGITGTDVAREASDMVLTDDNFATIVSAVEEGRQIYDNMKSFIRYMLSSNFDEILVVLVATVFLGWESPYLAIGILWINLMTDGLPALALSVDPGDPDIMKRKPRGKGGSMMKDILIFSIIAGVISFASTMIIFAYYYIPFFGFQDLEKARTAALTITVVFEMFQVFVSRTPDGKSVFKHNPFSNKFLVFAVLMAFLLHVCILYIPPFAAGFHMTSLAPVDWLYIIGIVLICVVLLDVIKILQSRNGNQKVI